MLEVVVQMQKPPTFWTSAAGGAVLAGFMVIVAYFLKVAAEEWIEWRRRERRRSGILSALESEARDTLMNYRLAYAPPGLPPDDARHPRAVSKARFAAALLTGAPHVPFVTVVAADFLWEQIRGDLVMVEPSVLDEATRFYCTDRLLNQRLLDLRSGAWLALSIARQEAVMMQVYDLYVPKLLESGQQLLAAIEKTNENRKLRDSATFLKAIVSGALAALFAAFGLAFVRVPA
jgi:hypothetical protein